MSNVLTPETKKAVWREYRARFVLAGSLIVLAVAVFAEVALLPSYFALRSTDDLIVASSEEDVSIDRAAIAETQALLTTLRPLFGASTTPTMLLQRALLPRPEGATVNHISYSAGTQGTLLLAGRAPREGINAYKAALGKESLFKNVIVPVSNLIGTEGGQFSITISGTF